MMRRLLISIRQLQKSSLIVGTSHKSDTCGKVVRGESRGNRDGGNKHEEGIQVRNALCVHKRWIHAVLYQSRLVLDRLERNGVEWSLRITGMP